MVQSDEVASVNRTDVAAKAAAQQLRRAAAMRANEEAAKRRQSMPPSHSAAVELRGREGLEPVRYGDWEVKGLATDF